MQAHAEFDSPPPLNFDNSFVRELPGDDGEPHRPRPVRGACYSHVPPTPVAAPRLLVHAHEVAELLGFSPAFVRSERFARVFAGNELLPGMQPYSACYGGHQFGNWAGQLGDGRAITLGEVLNARNERWELQLKGAGRTPYSRTADGRAVLRSSLREFLCSEAMFHLGVPTTRALCLVETGERVVRDMLYDGHPRAEPGAIVCRVAPSFLRFGNYEIFASRQDLGILKQLTDYTLRTHFSELGAPGKDAYLALIREVSRRTGELMAHWMRIGFVHGVMNTDNMSILGLTIDYGPFGMLDHFDPDFTPNTTDAHTRRYRYAHQPVVARWNLFKLAEALLPLIDDVPAAEAALDAYAESYEACQRVELARKLGLPPFRDDKGLAAEDPNSDTAFIDQLFDLLGIVETDFTIFFRCLAKLPIHSADEAGIFAALQPAYYSSGPLPEPARQLTLAWIRRYAERARDIEEAERVRRMNAANPKFILRNYLAQQAIDAAEQGDPSVLLETLEVLRDPYSEQPGREAFAEKRPDWARNRVGCSQLSCSS
ncbi:MAG: protein adenylyltransferase SelO [Myxococcota bacterium]